MLALIILAVAAVAFAMAVARLLLGGRLGRKPHLGVPVVPGLPFLGNSIALGRGGVAFITQCRQRFGDTFCLTVFGQPMVFVFAPSAITTFFKAPESSISFKPAVKQFTQRIYGLPSNEFFGCHEDLLATLRQLLAPSQLQDMAQQLVALALPQLQDWRRQGKIELWSACQHLVFAAAGQVLFGSAFFARHGLAKVKAAFLDFEGAFELAASPIPHLLLPRFREARASLLSMLSKSLHQGDFEGTVVSQLLQGCGLDKRLWPHLLLAVLWASQANSMPAMFWSLALVLLPQHSTARARILQDLQDTARTKLQEQQPQEQPQERVMQATGTTPQQQQQQEQQQQHQEQQQASSVGGLDDATVAAMVELAMDKRSWVSRCVAEAIRLRVHSIAVRFVSDDQLLLVCEDTTTTINGDNTAAGCSTCCKGAGCTCATGEPTNGVSTSKAAHLPGHASRLQQQPQQPQQCKRYHVAKGTVLCICPFESHHDPTLYPDAPWSFNPDRDPVQGLAPGTVVPAIGGMGFGGGFWRCPGRFFAEMELALLLQLLLHEVKLTPLAAIDCSSSGSSGKGSACGNQTSWTQQGQEQPRTRGPLVADWSALGQQQQQQQQQHRQHLLQGQPQAEHQQDRLQQMAHNTAQQWPPGRQQKPSWWRDVAVFGLGACGGSSGQAAAWCGSGLGSNRHEQPLVGGRLPQCELLRLVGFKVPAEPWWVQVD